MRPLGFQETWLGGAITLQVAAHFAFLSAFAIALQSITIAPGALRDGPRAPDVGRYPSHAADAMPSK
jgi:hypothetical protein